MSTPQQPGDQPYGGQPYGTPDAQPHGAPGQPAGQPPYGPPAQPYGAPSAQPYGQPAAPPYGGQPGGQPYGPPGGQPFGAPGQQPPYGQNPYGAYPNSPYGQPPTKSRRPLFLIIGGVVAAIVAVIVVLGVIGAGAGNPRDTADEFMAALKAKNVDKAHSLLCKDGKEKETKDELRTDFGLTSKTITNYTLGTETTRDREDRKETLIPVTIDYDQGAQLTLQLGIWNEGGQKVCSLNDASGN